MAQLKKWVFLLVRKGKLQWNDFTIKHKNIILNAWKDLTNDFKGTIMDQWREDLKLSNEENSNWNTDDWARLIHLFADPALLSLWSEIMLVRSFPLPSTLSYIDLNISQRND
jgi:hypothetical protein